MTGEYETDIDYEIGFSDGKKSMFDTVSEIMNWRMSLLGKTAANDLIKQELDIIMSEIMKSSQ